MKYEIELKEDAIIVNLTGYIMGDGVKTFLDGIMDELRPSIDSRKIIFDFKYVYIIDSAFLSLLIDVRKNILGCDIALCNLNQKLKTIFKFTRLDKVFSVEETR